MSSFGQKFVCGMEELRNYESLQMNHDRILITKDKLWKNCKHLVVVGMFNC